MEALLVRGIGRSDRIGVGSYDYELDQCKFMRLFEYLSFYSGGMCGV